MRQVAARLARLEAMMVEPVGPTKYVAVLSDGCPLFPRAGEDPEVPLRIPDGARVYRASFTDGREAARAGEP